jgi:KDO2-lipid IV(A) lauroyltransferase
MQMRKTEEPTTRPGAPWKPTADWEASTNSLHNARYLYPIHLFSHLVPRSVSHAVAKAIGTVLAYTMGKARKVVRHNIEHVGRGRFPSRWMHRAILRTFQNYARYIVDFMCLLWMKPSEIHSVIRHQNGRAAFDSLLSQGRGAILVTPHLGHWELGGMLLAADGYPMNVAGLLGDDPWTRRMRNTIRERLGLRVIELTDQTSIYAIIPLIEALRKNGRHLQGRPRRPHPTRRLPPPKPRPRR